MKRDIERWPFIKFYYHSTKDKENRWVILAARSDGSVWWNAVSVDDKQDFTHRVSLSFDHLDRVSRRGEPPVGAFVSFDKVTCIDGVMEIKP